MRSINVYLYDELPSDVQKDAFEEYFEELSSSNPETPVTQENFRNEMVLRGQYFTATGSWVHKADFKVSSAREASADLGSEKGEWFTVMVQRTITEDAYFHVFAKNEDEAETLVKDGKGIEDLDPTEVSSELDFSSTIVWSDREPDYFELGKHGHDLELDDGFDWDSDDEN